MNESIKKPLTVNFQAKDSDNDQLIVDTIAKYSPLSKSLIKKLMVYGAVFQTIKAKRKRVRKAKSILKAGNRIECYFDPNIDFEKSFDFRVIFRSKHYGIFHKPMGALTEGNNYGDKTSLKRSIEKDKKNAYIVNRLDIHTEGLVMVAFDSQAQNKFQEMWREKVTKKYQAIVLGVLEGSGEINKPINKKPSQTKYESLKIEDGMSFLDLTLTTERNHQARIHLAGLGYPIMGDSKYGKYNKTNNGLELISYFIGFKDPYTNKEIEIYLPEKKRLFNL